MSKFKLSFRQSFGLARWYARRDLFEASAKPTSRVIILSIGLATTAALVCLGLPFIVKEVRLIRLAENPTARSLWVYHETERMRAGSGTGGWFDSAALSELRNRVAERLPESKSRCVGFHGIKLDCAFYSTNENRYSQQRSGRTIARDDPLNDGLAKLLVAGKSFTQSDQSGIIVSRKLLKTLNYANEIIQQMEHEIQQLGHTSDPAKQALFAIRNGTGAFEQIPIVGITKDPFPSGHLFAITEAEDMRLESKGTFGNTDSISTGPIPADWPQASSKPGHSYLEQLPPKVRAALVGFDGKRDDKFDGKKDDKRDDGKKDDGKKDDKRDDGTPDDIGWDIQPYLKKEGGKMVWNLCQRGGVKLPLVRWTSYVIQLNNLMKEYGFADGAPTFVNIKSSKSDSKQKIASLGRGNYNWASIYVAEVKDLRPAVAAITELKLECDETAIPQIEAIEADFEHNTKVLWLLLIFFGSSVAISLNHMMRLRARLKKKDIGMLRAMGISDHLLSVITIWEAVLLWTYGTRRGLFWAALLAALMAFIFDVRRDELGNAAAQLWLVVLILCFFPISLFWCVRCALRAIKKIRAESPIVNLSSDG